ncbi:hypothetical protein HanXRQr2_Chr12g0543201 [Helianthus annuus]|uniref:Uncharacterized protein n=1 Tax=Helianthus annuus TaxID=4232 RepID=A0A9K3MW81_HELAN|nr:hypothetical protein HanXRQr2_Chr12g0543201 [Helianthus annuus]
MVVLNEVIYIYPPPKIIYYIYTQPIKSITYFPLLNHTYYIFTHFIKITPIELLFYP